MQRISLPFALIAITGFVATAQAQVLVLGPTPGLTVEVYDGTGSGIASADAARGSNIIGTPVTMGENAMPFATVTTADLGTNGDGAFAGQAGVPAPGGGNSYAVFLTGFIEVDNTGNPGNMWTFGTFADDASRIRIDLDQDGILEGDLNGLGGVANETVAFQGGCCSATLGSPVTLNDGVYAIEAVFTEGGGGDYGEFFYAPGNPAFNTTNFALLGDNSLGITAATSAELVPEPVSVAIWSLMGLGLALFGYYRVRQSR